MDGSRRYRRYWPRLSHRVHEKSRSSRRILGCVPSHRHVMILYVSLNNAVMCRKLVRKDKYVRVLVVGLKNWSKKINESYQFSIVYKVESEYSLAWGIPRPGSMIYESYE